MVVLDWTFLWPLKVFRREHFMQLEQLNSKCGCLHTEKVISYKCSLTQFPIFSSVVQYHMTKCPEGICCSLKRGGLPPPEGRLIFSMLLRKYNELLTHLTFYNQENFLSTWAWKQQIDYHLFHFSTTLNQIFIMLELFSLTFLFEKASPVHLLQPRAGWVSPLPASPGHFLGRGSSFDMESTIVHQVHL